MMRTGRPFKRTLLRNHKGESGQTTIFVVLVLGLFLIGAVGLAIDYSNVWFHRQAAQGAADAACQAGAMDMLVLAGGNTVPTPGFTVGTAFDCSANPTAVPCQYALRNGYDGSTGLVPNTVSTGVAVSFPPSVPGVTAPPVSLAGAFPFMRVDVTDRTKMYFSTILTNVPVQDVNAHATCGLQLAQAPIPIIVLNPTCPHAFQISGSAYLKIVGGPSRSVQVNSSYSGSACATAGSNSGQQCGTGAIKPDCPCTSPTCSIDLCEGGPNFSGSAFGTYGTAGDPTSSNFSEGKTGSWQRSSPLGDPFATTPPPAVPAEVSTMDGYGYKKRNYHESGCPNPAGCRLYYPGRYTQPIAVDGFTAIFVPGIYYMDVASPVKVNCGDPSICSASKPNGSCDAEFELGSGGLVRPADCSQSPGCNDDTQSSHTSGGTMFYLNGGGMSVNAGGSAGNGIDPFPTSLATCPDGAAPDAKLNLPPTISGNVMLGQCTNDGKYTAGAATGTLRGLLVFQNRSVYDLHKQIGYNGNGQLLMAGTIYAHNDPDYKDFIQFQGTSGNQTYLLGEVVTDQLVISGNAALLMNLNKNAVYYILKAALLE